jgi:hypothetical protein
MDFDKPVPGILRDGTVPKEKKWGNVNSVKSEEKKILRKGIRKSNGRESH